MVATRETVVEIEVDGPHNECLMFGPLSRRIRGRFDLKRDTEPEAARQSNKWPIPLPGQRLGIDVETGEAYIFEPLHAEPAMKRKIESLNFELPPEREAITGASVPTWLFWMKRAVESGLARLTRGRLPDKIEGKIQKQFLTKEPEGKSKDEAMIEAFQANTAVMQALLKRLERDE